MAQQTILRVDRDYRELDAYFEREKVRKILLVCDGAFPFLRLSEYFEKLESRMGISVIRFGDFKPNPAYESVVKGVELFGREHCDLIAAVGGGSAMDVAKCIKLFSNLDPAQNYLEQTIIPNETELLAVPTTAGTGSEATRYAVIYFRGEKQSVSHESCIPQTVVMDVSALKTLPEYQRKSTMMDALCHAVESFWSIHSTEESRQLSKMAIKGILDNREAYLANTEDGNRGMLEAAHLAGKAIDLTQTTAGHAMCYKLTSLYGIAHGHGAALCLTGLWPYMLEHMEACADPRGQRYLKGIFAELAQAMGYDRGEEAAAGFRHMFEGLALPVFKAEEKDYTILTESVNPVRLKNNPVFLKKRDISAIYRQILGT